MSSGPLQPRFFGVTALGLRCDITLRSCTTMEILGGTPGQPVDCCSLLQIPLGVSLLISSVGPAVPRDDFSPAPASEYSVQPDHTAIHLHGNAMFKLGISPQNSAGRIAYVRPVAGGHLVLTLTFPVHPELFYCDSALHAPDTQGGALKFFCDDGGFGELEHRSPALRCGDDPQSLLEAAITQEMFVDDHDFSNWRQQYLNPAGFPDKSTTKPGRMPIPPA